MEPAKKIVFPIPEPVPPRNRLRAVLPPASTSNSRLVASALWAIGISMALFFLPLLNGLIGGFVGGYLAGSVKRGLIAMILPAAAVGAGLWLLFATLGAPVFGVLVSSGAAVMIAMSEIGIFLGAAIGGYAAQNPRSTD
ncbi:MAG: hypothetical protein ACXVBE_06490 [Bdellovibrionota bacterium]